MFLLPLLFKCTESLFNSIIKQKEIKATPIGKEERHKTIFKDDKCILEKYALIYNKYILETTDDYIMLQIQAQYIKVNYLPTYQQWTIVI